MIDHAKLILNEDLKVAELLMQNIGMEIRVVKKDGKSGWITMDVKENRINVEIENNTITKIDGIY